MRVLSFLSLLALLALPNRYAGAQTPPESPATRKALEAVATDAEDEADRPHLVPFASENNRIELAVANAQAEAVGPVRISVTDHPAWLTITPEEVALESVTNEKEELAVFHFAVDRAAPVGEVGQVQFDLAGVDGQTRVKEVRLEVEAPKEVALQGNYPNPFNPRTTIGYELPAASQVTLRIYDVLGRRVATLVERDQEAGYHEATWEAGRFASGLYLYRLDVNGASVRTVRQGRMLLVK